MKLFLKSILSHSDGRYSLRKFIALYSTIIVAAILTFCFANVLNAFEFVVLWLGYSLIMLGIITAEHLELFRKMK